MPLKLYQEQINVKTAPKQVIAIAAGKGGVGKSTVTVNLARTLQHLGYYVGVLDADIYGPSIRMMLPEDQLPQQKDQLIIPAISKGIPLISMAYFRKANESAAVRAPIANNIVAQFLKNIVWGPIDFLLIDFPPGTGDIQLTLCQQAAINGAIMVTTPQEVAVLDVRKAMHLFEQVQVPIIGVIENMSGFLPPGSTNWIHPFGKGGGERLAENAGVPFLGGIPLSPDLCACGDSGKSIFDPQIDVVPNFIEITNKLIAHLDLINEQSNSCLGKFELKWKD